MCKLSEDEESIVRAELVQHIPSIALYCQSHSGLKLVICQQLVPYIVKLLNDIVSVNVRKLAQTALIVLLENNLIGQLQLTEWICPLIAQLATCESNLEEQRVEDVTVMSSMIPLVEKDIALKFFLEPFVSLCADHVFCIRTVCAMRMGALCKIAGTETTETTLLPAFINLCNDDSWGVKKACADVFVDVANVVTVKTRREILPDLFINLLSDHSRYVKNAAYQSIGGFIYSFHDASLPPEPAAPPVAEVTRAPSPRNRVVARSASCERRKSFDQSYSRSRTNCASDVSGCSVTFDKGDSSEGGGAFRVQQQHPHRPRSDSSPRGVVSSARDGHLHVHVDNETVFNNFQFWRVPLPEVELDVDIDKGRATHIHIRARVDEAKGGGGASSEIRLRIQEGDGDTNSSRFQVQTACINTFTPQSEEDKLEADDVTYSSFKESVLTLKDDFVEVEELVNSTTPSESSRSSSRQRTTSELEASFETHQSIVPPRLLSKYLEAANKSTWDVIDDDLIAHCAYVFPAVAYTLGSRHWPCIRHTCHKFARDMKWNVRKTIASSLHELAAILGRDITTSDLRPIFLELLTDVDEVRMGLVLHLSDFLKHLSPGHMLEFLPDMEEFAKTDHERNWRYRCAIAEQLIPTMDLYDPFDIKEYFLPIASTLLQDRVFAVRYAAAEFMAVIVKHLFEDAKNAVLVELDSTYRQAHKWNWRQTYVFFCDHLAKQESVSAEEFSTAVLPGLFSLARDKVPNVRLAVARCIAHTLRPRDYLPCIEESKPLLEVVYALLWDAEEDVRHFARLLKETFSNYLEEMPPV